MTSQYVMPLVLPLIEIDFGLSLFYLGLKVLVIRLEGVQIVAHYQAGRSPGPTAAGTIHSNPLPWPPGISRTLPHSGVDNEVAISKS